MEELILSLCSQHGKLKDSHLNPLIAQNMPYNEGEKVQAINHLLGKGKISISEDAGEVVYQSLSETHANSMKRLEGEDILVLQMIREAGEKGVWNGEIKVKTGIPITQVNKYLTNLEKQKLIFSKKSVHHNKKIWFLEGITPTNDVTGGFLFADQEFDKNLMSDLFTQIKVLLSEKASSTKDVLFYVKQQVNKNIKEENIKEVLASMVALGEVQEVQGLFRSISSFAMDPVVIPCIACHLRFECRTDGVVNPADCEYLNSWLSF